MATLLIEEALVALAAPVASTYWQLAPKDAPTPRIVISKVSGAGYPHAQGTSSLRWGIFQFDVYATTALLRSQKAKALKDVLDGYRGTVTVGSNSLKISECTVENQRQEIDTETNTPLFRASDDYFFHWDEE